MKAVPLPLVGGSYADETRPWSMQDTCNWLPCSAERAGTRSESMLKTPPGLKPYAEVVNGYNPVRGMHEAEGKLFVVMGSTLYQISNSGVAIPLGTVPGTGRVVMDHNQISLGNEIVAVNGSAGYVYNTVTGVFERITDPGYPGASICRFIDGYIVQIEPQGRYAFNSAPAQALEYNTLDRFTSEVTPDRLVSIAQIGGELMLLSASSCEFFQNTGAAQQPFRSKRIALDKGCAGAYVVAEADNTVYWLGSDGYFYVLEGYSARRISTRPIEQAIRGLNWSQAFAYVWEDAGHTVIYWTFLDGQTWGYDAAEREWHRRESYGFTRWRPSAMARWRDKWYAGDFQKGRVWELDWDYTLEGDQEFVSSRTMAVIHDNQSRMIHDRLELVMDTGQQEVTPIAFPEQPEAPTITGDAPEGFVGSPYSYTYTGSGGTGTLTYSVAPGDELPDGLTINASTGELSGTPTTVGEFEFSIRVTDAEGLWDEVADELTVASAAWFAGPVFEDGAGGGSSSFYLKAGSLEGLLAATPLPNPTEGSGEIERVSVANGGVFLHRATLASVSFDTGGTWAAADSSLFVGGYARDVYWNGTKYYYGGLCSTDGLVWTAIPNLPATALVQNARDSDGMVTVQSTDGIFHTSVDDGANWVARADFGAGVGQTAIIATDGSDFVLSASSNFHYYSTDDLTTPLAPTTQNDNCFSSFYSNGAWYVLKFLSGDGITAAKGIVRATAAAVWPNANFVAGFAFIQEGVELDTDMMAFDGAGVCAAWEVDGNNRYLYGSEDNGVTWALLGTLYGGANLAFVEAA